MIESVCERDGKVVCVGAAAVAHAWRGDCTRRRNHSILMRTVAEAVDLLSASRSGLLALSFAKSPSDAYPLAVNVAQGAACYAEVEIGKQTVHLVGFAKTPADAARALALLQYVAGWKTTQVFAAGRLAANVYTVAEVLECYLQASACTDCSAHCSVIMDDPDSEVAGEVPSLSIAPSWTRQRVEVDRYLFPCAFLQPRFSFQPDHPASPRDQIQAAAVKEGCAWCPYFNVGGFRKAGTRVASTPIFE